MARINAFGVASDICAAFTGYRPEKMRVASLACDDMRGHIGGLIRPVIRELYVRGTRVFLSGMADGFDLWAAAEVIALRDCGECPAAEVVAVIPYRGQAAGYGKSSAELYDYISGMASYRIVLSDSYYTECFHRRNDYLVDNSGIVVAYYDGQSGGTRYTVKRAGKCGVPVINLCARELELF